MTTWDDVKKDDDKRSAQAAAARFMLALVRGAHAAALMSPTDAAAVMAMLVAEIEDIAASNQVEQQTKLDRHFLAKLSLAKLDQAAALRKASEEP